MNRILTLLTDLGETKNVQAAHGDVVERLTILLEQTISNGRSIPGPKQANNVSILVNKANTAAPKE
jgi:hypothetical protein